MSPQAPQLCAIANGSRAARICIGSDNPDNLYENAVLDGRREYVVHGVRGTVAYLGLGTQSGAYGAKGGLATVDYAEAETLRYDDAARTRFTLVLSATRPADATNWLQLVQDPPEAMFIVRQTFGRRTEEVAASLSIVLRGEGGGIGGGTPLTPKRLDDGLQSASVLVAGASAMFAKWAYGFQAHANALPLFDQQTSDRAGGDPNIRYYHSYWRLPAGMALRILVRPPPCRCWNFQLNSASRRTSNLAPPRRAAPRHATPRHTTPRHATPRHTTPRHATPRHTTPRHTTPRHTTPRHAIPRHAKLRLDAIRALVALHRGLTPLCTHLTQTTGWRASTTGTSPYTPTAAWRDPTQLTLRASR
jgi:hypothetical protein